MDMNVIIHQYLYTLFIPFSFGKVKPCCSYILSVHSTRNPLSPIEKAP